MMRRSMCLGIAVLMIFTAGAVTAEQGPGQQTQETQQGWDQFGLPTTSVTPFITVTPGPNAFRFRDGIRWSMNPQQVQALEPEQMTLRTMADWSVMLTDTKVVVSLFTADLVFMFRQNMLQMISYEFTGVRQDDFRYLGAALSTVYGESTEGDPLTVKALMDAINPNRYKSELIKNTMKWVTADDTSVYLYYYSENAFAITYVSPELGAKVYQVNGL